MIRVNPLTSVRGRRVLFTALYISEGAPIGFLWWALPAQLRLAGVPVPQIAALTATLVLPWTLKFIWAPAVDRLQLNRVGFRAWIVAAQLAMGLTLLPLLGSDLAQDFAMLTPWLVLHAIAAATQDVAVDGLALSVVAADERGQLQAYTQAGMLAARAIFGGGALWLIRTTGLDCVVLALVTVTWSSVACVVLTWSIPEPTRTTPAGAKAWFQHALGHLATRTTALALGFALVSGAGFEAVGALAGPMLVDQHVDSETLAFFFAGPTVMAMVLGGFLGGRLSDHWPRASAVLVALIASAGSVGLVAATHLLADSPALILAATTLCYLTIGCFVTSSYALFMDLSDRGLGATHFSIFMGATNACEAWSGWAAGRLQPSIGYGGAFLTLAGVSLISSLFLLRLAQHATTHHLTAHR